MQPRMVWQKLKGRIFNDLHSLVFEGIPRKFSQMAVDLLRRAPNITNIDLRYLSPPHQELPCSLGDSVPCLSTLRIRGFWISWTSPFLRNLSQLTLDLGIDHNCPDLETLDLAFAGPDFLSGHQDNCDRVIGFRKPQEISLVFHGPSRIPHILSHIDHPDSTYSTEVGSLDSTQILTPYPKSYPNPFHLAVWKRSNATS